MKQKTKKALMLISTIFVLVIDLIYAFNIYSGVISLENFNNDIPISKNSQIGFLALCSIINFILIFLILRNPLQNKKKIIILNIIQFLFGNIFNIISGIFNIILVSTKTKDVESEIKEKKELPVLEDITKHKWYTYFMIFVFLFIICYTPITDLLPEPQTKISALIRIIILYIIQISFLVVPMCNELKRDFIVFKNNFKLYLYNMLPRFVLILIAYMLTNLSLVSFVGNISTNQSIISQWPLFISAPIAIIIAPLTEELMFRGFMKKFIKNNTLFLILSSIIFGGLHVVVASNIEQILFIIPYSILGFAFSLNYVRTKNIASNIFLHGAWNSIAIVALIISKLI